MLQTIKQHASFHLLTFLSKNRDRWPRWIVNTALFAAGIIVAGMWMSITHPAAGEIWQNQLISVMLLLISCGALFFAGVIVRGFYLSCVEITRDMPNTYGPLERVLLVAGIRLDYAPALLVSTWMPPDSRPDILICSLPGEGPEQFAARMDDAIEQANVARWVVVLQQGNPAGMIYGAPDASSEFRRDWPPFQTENWLPEQRIVPTGTRFRGETETEFQQYVERFMLHFPEWAALKKITGEKSRSGFVFQQVVRAASVVILLLFSLAAFGQKSAKLAATEIANDKPPANAPVSFIFEKTDIYRTGNGSATYAELLKSAPGYRDNGGGELIAVMVGNKSTYKALQTQDVADKSDRLPTENRQPTKAAAMRPHNETVNPGEVRGGGFQLPDSARMIEMAEVAQYEIWKASKTAGAMAKPWWEVVMSTFWIIYPILLIFAIVAWVSARVFASEGMIREHKVARRSLVIVLLSVAAVVLINLMLWAISTGVGPLALTLFGGFLAGVAYFIVSRLTPNFNPARGNEPERGRFGGNYPQLNG